MMLAGEVSADSRLTPSMAGGTLRAMSHSIRHTLRVVLQFVSALLFIILLLLLILAGLTATTKDRTVLISLALIVVVLPVCGYMVHHFIGWLLTPADRAGSAPDSNDR